jgi:ribosomal-protein-alanine N-acetyltransferase
MILQTKNLIIREILPSDVDGIFELDSNSEVHRYMGGHVLNNKKEAEDRIQHIRQQYIDNGIGRWAVIEKKSGDFIGWTGIKLEDIETNGFTNYYDLGYRFIPRYWGKGYGFESTLDSFNHIVKMLDLKKVCGAAHIDNIGSNRILQKVGLKFINEFIYDGAKHNWYEINLGEK